MTTAACRTWPSSAFLVDRDGIRGAWRYETGELPDFDELLAAAARSRNPALRDRGLRRHVAGRRFLYLRVHRERRRRRRRPPAGDHLQSVYRFWLVGHQLEQGEAPGGIYSFQPIVEPQTVLGGWPFGLPFGR